jgi:uncharacterized YigZ family protein
LRYKDKKLIFMNQPGDIYKTIAAPCSGVFKDKGSKFLAYAFPVDTVGDVKQQVQHLKKEYFDARHHCYAYRIGVHGEQWRANDDGEPSSTAGKPILGQLLSQELTNVLIVVVRYFGGIQLGVPGLINAYRSAASDALAHAQIVEKTAKEQLTFCFSYEAMNDVMKWLKEEKAEILSQQFDAECVITIAVPRSRADDMRDRIERVKREKR